MDIFKNWVLSICGATIIVSLIRIVFNNSNIKKTINIFLSLFVILYTVFPLNDENINFDNIEIYSQDIDNELLALDGYNKIIVKSIETVCEKNNINVLNIKIDSYINSDEVFVVKKIIIKIDDENKKEYIINEIKSETGFEVSVE